MELAQYTPRERSEMSLVEIAYAMLVESGEVHDFNQLLEKIQNYLSLTDEQLENKMVRFYTDINVDGRFISLGENRWGLRSWYAIDAIDEEIVNSLDDEDLPRHRRRKKKSALNAFAEGDGDMIDYNDDDPEDIDDIYDDLDDEDYDEDEDEDDNTLLPDRERSEDEEDDEELNEYATDLSELGDDDIDIDDIELDEEDDDDEEDDEDEEDDLID